MVFIFSLHTSTSIFLFVFAAFFFYFRFFIIINIVIKLLLILWLLLHYYYCYLMCIHCLIYCSTCAHTRRFSIAGIIICFFFVVIIITIIIRCFKPFVNSESLIQCIFILNGRYFCSVYLSKFLCVLNTFHSLSDCFRLSFPWC